MKSDIAVIYGSYRTNRQGIKATKFIIKKLEERGFSVTLLDAKEINLPVLDKRYKDYEQREIPENLEKAHKSLIESDGYIIVSGEYNHGVVPGLKNFLDHFMPEYFFKPAGIVSYSAGPFGGVRYGVQLRVTLGELGMVSLPSIFPVSAVQNAFDEDGNDKTGDYERRAKKFLDEFEWYVNALKAARNKGTPY